MDEFTLKFFVALTVVLAVSLVTLGFRVGLVVAAAVPLTLAAVFVIMLLTHRVFDRITLGALILSLGLLVDDAIIAIEMMVVKMQEGLQREAAASFAWTVTAAPMLSGTLVAIIGLMPVGFADSSAGEYAGNIFWMVAFALLASWVVAVFFTPYLGVKLLPDIPAVAGGHEAIYATPRYRRLRRLITSCVDRRGTVALCVVAVFGASVAGLIAVRKEFFPVSDRPEVLIEVYRAHGTNLAATEQTVTTIEEWLKKRPEAKLVTSYIGQGAPRFFLSLNPELPDSSFAKLIVLTPDPKARDDLKAALRVAIAAGLAPEARLRVTQLLFGPPVPYAVAFRVIGPDVDVIRGIASRVREVMAAEPSMRDTNLDWGEKTPAARIVFDENQLRLVGLDPKDAADQLQFLLTGIAVTQVREDIRTVQVTARTLDTQRLDPATIGNLSLTTRDGRSVPLTQVGRIVVQDEDPIFKRRDREPVLTVRGDIDETLQPSDVTKVVLRKLEAVKASLPEGFRIETAGSVEESAKANVALGKVFPVMILFMLTAIMLQVRNFRGLAMVFMTAPLGPRRSGSDPAGVRSAVRLQRDPRPDRLGRDPDAEHVDPARPDRCRSQGGNDAPRGGDRSDGPPLATRRADGRRRNVRLHPAHVLQLLGADGVHTDWRGRRRHIPDDPIPSRALRIVLQDPSTRLQQRGKNIWSASASNCCLTPSASAVSARLDCARAGACVLVSHR